MGVEACQVARSMMSLLTEQKVPRHAGRLRWILSASQNWQLHKQLKERKQRDGWRNPVRESYGETWSKDVGPSFPQKQPLWSLKVSSLAKDILNVSSLRFSWNQTLFLILFIILVFLTIAMKCVYMELPLSWASFQHIYCCHGRKSAAEPNCARGVCFVSEASQRDFWMFRFSNNSLILAASQLRLLCCLQLVVCPPVYRLSCCPCCLLACSRRRPVHTLESVSQMELEIKSKCQHSFTGLKGLGSWPYKLQFLQGWMWGSNLHQRHRWCIFKRSEICPKTAVCASSFSPHRFPLNVESNQPLIIINPPRSKAFTAKLLEEIWFLHWEHSRNRAFSDSQGRAREGCGKCWSVHTVV